MSYKDLKIIDVQITIDSLTLLAIIGNLQLALSHPQNNGKSAEIAMAFIKSVSLTLSEIDPFYKIAIEAGFDRNKNN